MREGSYHVEALALLKANPGTHYSAKQIADKLEVDPKRASLNSVLREIMRKHTPHVHRQKLNKPEQTRQFYYWFDENRINDDYEGHIDGVERKLPPSNVEQRFLDAVDDMISGLADSDFVTHCGDLAIKEMREYRLDMAKELQGALA